MGKRKLKERSAKNNLFIPAKKKRKQKEFDWHEMLTVWKQEIRFTFIY